MQVKLIVVSGKANKPAVTLTPPIVIGRSRQAELTVGHPMISRRHCELYEVDGLLMIRDLGSLNGTTVEGQQIEEAPLCPGNEFSLGPLTFRVEYEFTGDLASLPAARIAKATPPPAVEGTAAPAALHPDDETPAAGRAARPPLGQAANPNVWDQTATEGVPAPEPDAGIVEIDELATAQDEPQQSEPPAPPAPPAQKTHPADSAKRPAVTEEQIDEFLRGLD